LTRTYVDTGFGAANNAVVNAVMVLVKAVLPEVRIEVGNGVGTTTSTKVEPATTVVNVKGAAVPEVIVVVLRIVGTPITSYVVVTGAPRKTELTEVTVLV
jgi:hypothetical protein